MRVAFVIQNLQVGGAQRAVVSLANQLVSRRIDVSLYLLSADKECAYELDGRVKLYATGLAISSSGLVEALKNNVSRVMQLRSRLKSDGIEIVVGMSYTVNVIISLATVATPIVAIGSERSHPEFDETTFVWKQVRAHCYRGLRTLVCLTEETARWVTSNTSLKRVDVIPNGVDIPLAMTSPVVDIPELLHSRKVVLSVGRLVVTKQFGQLIRVFSAIASDHPEWVLVIAGDGPEYSSLQSCISDLALGDRVFLLGAVGNLHDWYEAASIFVFLSTIEGFPNSLLEAMAYGVACISYDCKTGPGDLISDRVNGELIAVNDTDSVRGRLANLMIDSVYRDRISVEAAKTAETFSIDRVADRWQELLISHVPVCASGESDP